MTTRTKTCLWFNTDGEDAARFYVSLLPDSRIDDVQLAPGPWPNGKGGEVLVIDFTLGGTNYQALNGGSQANYGTCASISVDCADQAEVDQLWAAFIENGGQPLACGWLRDRWGVPWQIVPEALTRYMKSQEPGVAARVFAAMQGMIKIDVAAIERAARG